MRLSTEIILCLSAFSLVLSLVQGLDFRAFPADIATRTLKKKEKGPKKKKGQKKSKSKPSPLCRNISFETLDKGGPRGIMSPAWETEDLDLGYTEVYPFFRTNHDFDVDPVDFQVNPMFEPNDYTFPVYTVVDQSDDFVDEDDVGDENELELVFPRPRSYDAVFSYTTMFVDGSSLHFQGIVKAETKRMNIDLFGDGDLIIVNWDLIRNVTATITGGTGVFIGAYGEVSSSCSAFPTFSRDGPPIGCAFKGTMCQTKQGKYLAEIS